MYRRPASVTIIGGLLAIAGFVGMLGILWAYTPADENSPVEALRHPDNRVAIVNAVDGLIIFVSGVNILKGRNWARWLYTLICVAALVLDLVFLREGRLFFVIIGNFVRCIFVMLLFTEESNDYFSASDRDR
jgi:hypothetical protein